jgi:hypothetical protein
MNTKSWRFTSLIGAATIAVTAGATFAATGMASDVFAANAPSGPTSAATPDQTAVPGVQSAASVGKEQPLIGTLVESGNGGGEVLPPEGFVTLDPVGKLTCPSGHTCTITSTISVQLVDHDKDASNLFAVPWKMDGNPAGEQGPFIGETLTDGLLSGGTWTDQQTDVTAGKHTVQSSVFTQKGGNLASWTVTYNLYD